ncbi:MAG: tetratricopeptide repeat protein [Bacteroidota bacterium]
MYFKTVFIKLIYVTAVVMYGVSCNNKSNTPASSQENDSTFVDSESAKVISRQIEADPENAELYYQRAVVYYDQKYLDRSLLDIEDALKHSNENPLYYFYKGKVLYAMNRTQEAAKAYEQALSVKPDYNEARLKLATLYYVVKEHQKSIDALNVVIAADPANAEAQFYKGMNQKEMKDTARAIASFQKTLEIDNRYYDAAMQLGLLFTEKRDPVAKEYFTTAIRLSPRSVEAYFGRAYYYQLVKQYQKSLFDYRKVIEYDPSNDKAYYNVGYINYEAGKYDEALRSWNICIEMNNQNVMAYYMRGLLHEQRKSYADAKLNYEYVLQLDPEYSLAKEGMQRLEKK